MPYTRRGKKLTGNLSLFLGGDLSKRADGQVDGVAVEARGTVVLDRDRDRLLVFGVRDLNLFAAERRGHVGRAVPALVCGKVSMMVVSDY